MSLQLVPLRARPDCLPLVFGPALQSLWPEFMMHDPAAGLYFDTPHFERHLDFAFAILDPARPESPVGRAFSVPFHFGGERRELPDSGWDGIIRWAHQDAMKGRVPNALSALEISLLPSHRGRGQSTVILNAMRRHAAAQGLKRLFAPVRPTAKSREPFLPMAEYLARQTADGFSVDPWVRTHERVGGRIVKIAPTSMVIPGTLAEWRRWTGLPLAQSGAVAIEGGLSPLLVSVEQDSAVYVEPNIWIEHSILTPQEGHPA
jgi:GNAT superfamily N-acetyltransferase